MLFVEPLFLFLFLPLVLLAERLTRGAKPEHRLFVITASGALFYAAWSWMYLLLLLAAIGCNHRVSLSIAHDVVTGKKRRAKRDGGSIDWIVMRNRLSHLDARNKRELERLLAFFGVWGIWGRF